MSLDTRVREILTRWEELARQGQETPAAELCQECPELLPEVQRQLQALHAVQGFQGPNNDATASAPAHPTPASEGPQPPAFLRGNLPCQFGRYVLQKRLGEGGMGTVYLAHDTILDCPVAVKVAKGQDEEDSQVVERFRREARAAANLRHEGLCRVMDFGQVDGAYYIAMEYIPGRSLAQHLRQFKNLPLEQRWSARIVAQIALALEAAHRQGVVHRDLKPGNILLDEHDRPRVVDFGLARRLHDSTLTKPGATPGTPVYMSPEQVQGKPVTASADIYSLGVILYELLTCRLPFRGEDIYQTFYQILYEVPQPPSAHRTDLDPALEAVCLKALAKTADGRFAGMGEFAARLLAFLEGATQQTAITSVEEIAPRDIFRIARPILPTEEHAPLPIDIGFFRARLKSVGSPTEPIFCGCASARLLVRFDGSRSLEDPSFPCLPPGSQARVEYGIGPRPSVRFEAQSEPRMLEGRARVAFPLEQTDPNALRVAVTLDPEWFTVEGPTGTVLDNSTKVVVNAMLRKLTGAVSRRFILGERNARA